MPSLILTGYPSVGKTSFGKLLKERALQHSSKSIDNVIIVSEDSACVTKGKMECYANSTAEKMTRGSLKTEFDKALRSADKKKRTLVILDSLNYIKGYRYELHCLSKAAGERHGVVWLFCSDESQIMKWNQARTDDKVSQDLMEQLMMRYETPDERNRWDKPLYRVDVLQKKIVSAVDSAVMQRKGLYNMHNVQSQLSNTTISGTSSQAPSNNTSISSTFKPAKKNSGGFKRATTNHSNFKRPSSDTPISTLKHEESTDNNDGVTTSEKIILKSNDSTSKPPSLIQVVDEILDSFLCNVEPLKEGFSTRSFASASADVLNNIDAITQQLCTVVYQKSTSAAAIVGNTKLVIPLPNQNSFVLTLTNIRNKALSLSELRRHRRNYIQWTTTHPPSDTTELAISEAFLTYLQTNLEK